MWRLRSERRLRKGYEDSVVLVKALFYASELADWGFLRPPAVVGSTDDETAWASIELPRLGSFSRKYDDVAIPKKLLLLFDNVKYSGRQLEKKRVKNIVGGVREWKGEGMEERGQRMAKWSLKGQRSAARSSQGSADRQLNPGEGDWLVRKPSDQVLL